MKYYLIAGEASGDLYGGLLIDYLKSLDADAEFRYWGGPQMKSAADGQFKSIKETSFMGFVEVARNIFKIRSLFQTTKKDILDWQPDIVIFIDYPGFNLRMLKWAKSNGFKTCFYISPQLWAWKKGRHAILRDYADLFFVILPFERDFYRNLDTACSYVGHPLLEIIPPHVELPEFVSRIGLFPGSRIQEIREHLPLMIKFASEHPEYNFIIAAVSHIDKEHYLKNIPVYLENMDIKYDASHEVMEEVDMAITSSGTATLELALFNVPQIVIYKTNPISFEIGKRLVKTNYISLVNLISHKALVPELLQDELTLKNLKHAFDNTFPVEKRKEICEGYARIRQELGNGNATEKVANGIFNFLSNQ